MRAWYLVPGLVLFASLPAFAATVEAVKGKVLIDRGDGFQQTTSGAQAKAGDRVMAAAGGGAKLVYSAGCQVKVIPGRVVSVAKQPPCTAPSLVGEDPSEQRWFSNPVVPFAITATIGAGIFCATIACRDEDGGRRFSQRQFDQPASP
jgi:hypothetical protein